MIELAAIIAGGMLGIAVLLTFFRLRTGPDVSDRVVALDLLSTLGIGLIAAYALGTRDVDFFDIAIIIAVLGFLGTVAFAYYVELRT